MPDYRRVKIRGGTYFFTLVTNQRFPIFLNKIAIDLFLDAQQHVRNFHPFIIVAFCILPDHIHLLWEMPNNDSDYSLRIGEIKKMFSKGYINKYGHPVAITPIQKKRGESGIWQRRFWEHYIRDENDLIKHIDYIHYNPVKHGLVTQAKDWTGSSFFSYVRTGYYDKDWGLGEMFRLDSRYFGE
jgi:putative transposase